MIRFQSTALVLSLPALLLVGSLVGAPPDDDRDAANPTAARASKPVAEPERDDEFDSKVARFMRAKLDASTQVLEGLVTEDFTMIEKGARTMEAMSRASEWQMIKGPVYIQFSNEFRKICEDLEDDAKEKNVDAAGLDYMRLTMGCISCHNFVRKTMMADHGRAPSFDLAGRR